MKNAHIRSSLAFISTQVEILENQATQAAQCRATLYVNFVMKETYGIQINKEQADAWTTHQLMVEILLKLKEKLS